MKHQGSLIIQTNGSDLKYRDVTDVDGFMYINANVELPALKSVSRWMDIRGDSDLRTLTTVGGHLNINADADLRALKNVGGDLHIYEHADADLPALTTVEGRLYLLGHYNMPELTTAHGVKGRLLCASTYGLWLGDNGLIYAGCREGLTIGAALKHWDRPDERAVMFTAAIKKLNAK
jgi:hypothetical protein